MEVARPGHERNQRPGYDLFFSLDPAPRPEEREVFRGAVVALRRTDAPKEPGEIVAATVGDVTLLLLCRPTEDQKRRLVWTPVLAKRRGSAVEPAGIDTEIGANEEIDDTQAPSALPLPEMLAQGLAAKRPGPPAGRHPLLQDVLARIGVEPQTPGNAEEGAAEEIVIAVIDSEHEADEGVEDAAFPRLGARAPRASGCHGDMMARIVSTVMGFNPAVRSRIRRIRIPASSDYLSPTDIAVAVAEAVEPRTDGIRPADVVLLAMSSGAWGTPVHLEAVLTEAARKGRNGRGAVIVCSSGRPNKSPTYCPFPGVSPGVRSVAHGADELGGHPDVLLVGPCDLAGRWLRVARRELLTTPLVARSMPGIQGRLGPAVTVVAPGIHTDVGTLADGSSQAAAIAAGVAALVLRANPGLGAAEVRQILRQTAFVPRSVDVARGPEALASSTFDRSGHNFKVGAGMIHPLAAVLSARDPFCQALFSAAETLEPPEDAYSLRLSTPVVFARWFDFVVASAPTGDEIAAGYKLHRRALARLCLRSIRAREGLLWLARHLLAIFTYEGRHSWTSDSGRQMGHGALRRRLAHLTATLREELSEAGPGDGPVREFLERARARILAASDREIEHAILLAFFGREAADPPAAKAITRRRRNAAPRRSAAAPSEYSARKRRCVNLPPEAAEVR